MAMLTIDLEDEIARHVEESARREHKSVSDWVKERLKPENDPAAALAAMESRAIIAKGEYADTVIPDCRWP